MSEQMANLHKRIATAVSKSVRTRGVSEQEAFRNHMKELMQQTPAVFLAYTKWLKETAAA